MGMCRFLASEVMFFGTLFAVYFYLHESHSTWPPVFPSGTKEVSFLGVTLVNTFILFSSAVTAHIGQECLRFPGRHRIGAIVLVLFVVATAGSTWAALGEAPFGALLGVIALVAQLIGLLTMLGVRAATLYWHFVDVVWFFLYGVLYVGIALQL